MLDLEAQKHVVDGKLRCWLDIDINDSRAAYQRAVDFVAAKNLAYSLTSNWLPELGGSELKRVKEQLYTNDFEWSGRGRCAVKMPPQRIYVEVWPEVAPLAVENFVALLLGNRGKGQESGCEMTYKGCHFHRCIKGFVAQGGDFVKNNGSGGECVFPGKKQGFKDDAAGLKVKLGERGMLAMGNSGKNTNTSQFFFTFGDVSRLTGKHVGFGRRDVDAPLRESQRWPSQSVTAPALSRCRRTSQAAGRRRRGAGDHGAVCGAGGGRLWQAGVPGGDRRLWRVRRA